jgi:histidyl-tRNA synthetase
VFDNLDAKPSAVQDALREAPTIGESLCEACRAHFASVRRDLDATGISYTLVPTLVRGLDYYTRTTWEFQGAGAGAQRSLSGGGRYDGLVEAIGGPATPGVGFGAGIERLILVLEQAGASPPAPAVDVFFAVEDGAPRERVAQWLGELRARGVASDTDFAGRSLKGQLTQAGRLGAATTVVVRGDGASIRRTGQDDVEVALDEVPARLLA